MENQQATELLRSRLLTAALDCFLADDYHQVTTRRIAELAGANVSMIRYYGPLLASTNGFADFLALYYRTMSARPEFPKLILKVLALRHGPGRRFIQQLLERGRTCGARKVADLKANGQVAPAIDPDILRLTFVSLAMTPMLLKDFFEEQIERPMDDEFLARLAKFNGHLLAAGLAPTDTAPKGDEQ